jgi:hypothetical protein
MVPSGQSVSDHVTPEVDAFVRTAFVRLALAKPALVRSALVKFAPDRLAAVKAE